MTRTPVQSLDAAQARRCHADEAIAGERRFAIRAAYDGIPTAFLSVLAEDSVVLGDGPEPGRKVYGAMPKSHPSHLVWEPILAGASADGSLAFTSGPYRMLNAHGEEESRGIYFSTWRRNRASSMFELVLDFGFRGAAFPESFLACAWMEAGAGQTGSGLAAFLEDCIGQGQVPEVPMDRCLGDAAPGRAMKPQGLFVSTDGELGVLWGARVREDGRPGAFAIVFTNGDRSPDPQVCVRA